MRFVSLIPKGIYETFYTVQAGAVDGLSIGAGCHITRFGVDTLVGKMEQVFPEQVAVHAVVLVGGVLAAFGQTV